MMADLGVKVTILEGLPKILPGCDADVAAVVLRSFKKKGIDVRTGVQVTGHTPGDTTTRIALEGADDLEVERVVVSVGRRPLSDSLGLDGSGVEVDERGFVKVDGTCRTTVDGVWAIGDLVATPQLAHVGFIEGINADQGHPRRGPRHRSSTTRCRGPSTASRRCRSPALRGLGEEAGYDVVVSKHQFRGNGRALIVGEAEGS
jgi:dihydrolipoamide dehydrogenase